MKLEELIKKKIETETQETLWKSLLKIIVDCKHHLSQITRQMFAYDIHDATHSEAVQKNIEEILENQAERLSCYELMLLYFGCYLHDAAMALPEWEYIMLRAVEGCHTHFDAAISDVIAIRNDFKPAQSLRDLKSFINANLCNIYGDFKSVENFVFSQGDEESLQIDLAKRAREYEDFRNEYADKLEAMKSDRSEYLNYSELIRSEFIRKTHNTRVVDYIRNLRRKLGFEIGDHASTRVLEDLSLICRAHGEDFVFVDNLAMESQIDGVGDANLQFVAILLRLGDIIHFSSDRAPISLFSEKRITNKESLIHWKAKFNNTRYEIKPSNEKRIISFSSFCTEFEVYYFLQEYLDLIDLEISHYFSFLSNLIFLKNPSKDKYDIQIGDKVNRERLVADETKFIPDHSAKFTMEQSKILSLLMGMQLYKDEFLCLRELYQNSLDACKCMSAQNEKSGVKREYCVEFGLGVTPEGKKYIYCLDNGTGMTKEIVKNYFLRIGNSYYKSREFTSKNVSWMSKVNPTSQFGIGVLSCFMLGDTIEVTTKYYDGSSDSFSFCLDGPNERFFYAPVNPLDNELVGPHGTLIKIILNESHYETVNDDYTDEFHYFMYASKNNPLRSKNATDYQRFKESLFFQINRQIGIQNSNVGVFINCIDNQKIPIVAWNKIFDYRTADIDLDRVISIWSDYRFPKMGNPYKETIECRGYIENVPVQINDSGVQLDTFISLPLKGIPHLIRNVFSLERYLWSSHDHIRILVDGITVPEIKFQNEYETAFGHRLAYSGKIILNFTGKARPLLSIDRSSIVQFPQETLEICDRLAKALAEAVVQALINHLESQNISEESEEAKLAVDLVLDQYHDFAGTILGLLGESKYGKIHIPSLAEHSLMVPEITGLINASNLLLTNIDFRSFNYISKELALGKAIVADDIEVMDLNVKISSNRFIAPSSLFAAYRYEADSINYAIRADRWDGDYCRYDLVSSLWPLVPERLFNKINDYRNTRNHGEAIDANRTKGIDSMGNGLMGIASIEPALVNPKFGISTCRDDGFGRKRSLIGLCENIQNMYWLFDLNDHGMLPREQKKDYALFVYINPKELSDEDKTKLNDYIDTDDTYIKGVQEGWSILFLGDDRKYFILPGICNRDSLVKLIPKSIRNREDGLVYYFLDETPVFGE